MLFRSHRLTRDDEHVFQFRLYPHRCANMYGIHAHCVIAACAHWCTRMRSGLCAITCGLHCLGRLCHETLGIAAETHEGDDVYELRSDLTFSYERVRARSICAFGVFCAAASPSLCFHLRVILVLVSRARMHSRCFLYGLHTRACVMQRFMCKTVRGELSGVRSVSFAEYSAADGDGSTYKVQRLAMKHRNGTYYFPEWDATDKSLLWLRDVLPRKFEQFHAAALAKTEAASLVIDSLDLYVPEVDAEHGQAPVSQSMDPLVPAKAASSATVTAAVASPLTSPASPPVVHDVSCSVLSDVIAGSGDVAAVAGPEVVRVQPGNFSEHEAAEGTGSSEGDSVYKL